MGTSTLLQTGQSLYVPPLVVRTPLPSLAATATSASTWTDTPESSLPSDTPTEASISTSTNTPIPSDTPSDFSTDTPVPTVP